MDKAVSRAKGALATIASRAPMSRRRKSHSPAARTPAPAQTLESDADGSMGSDDYRAGEVDQLEAMLVAQAPSDTSVARALTAYRAMPSAPKAILSQLYRDLRLFLANPASPAERESVEKLIHSMKAFRAAKRDWTEREARTVLLAVQGAGSGITFKVVSHGGCRKVQWLAKGRKNEIGRWLPLLIVICRPRAMPEMQIPDVQ